MLRRAFNTFLVSQNAAQTAATVAKQQNWDLYAGVLVERLPIITKSLTPLEQEYKEHLAQLEFEQSLKSDFEVREEKDKLVADLQKMGKIDEDIEVAQQTAQDLKDAWKEELKQYRFSGRITEADQKNDRKSLNRQLENSLILMVEQETGSKKHFILPQGKRVDGETMRECAERILKEKCGDRLAVQFYGNAPCGFYKYKYPVDQRSDTVGAKVFFFRSAYRSGQVDLNKVKNFEWLTIDDVEKRSKEPYFNSISQFVL